MLALFPEQLKYDITDRLNLDNSDRSTLSIIRVKNSQILSPKKKEQPTQKTGLFRRFISRITVNKQTEYPQLIGISIYPKMAQKFEEKIEFNGTGKIIAMKEKDITREDYNVLIKNRIKPLNETPQIMRERIRTPGEAIIDIAGLIKKQGGDLENKRELDELVKCTWLDGSLSQQSLHNTVELIKIKIGEHQRIIIEIDKIMRTLEKEFFVTKRNDNYYGRLFETELSKYIVNNPDASMLKVRDAISEFIVDNFSNIPEDEQPKLCTAVATVMHRDPPLWRNSLSYANIFILNKTPQCFIDMMNFKGKNSVPLVLSTAVKYIVLSQGTRDIKNRAAQYYINKILPQRQLIVSLNEYKNLCTADYGLLLPYQKYHRSNYEDYDRDADCGVRPIDKYIRPSAGVALTEHDAAALANERTIGIGMSGSSNILHFLFQLLQLRDESFPLDDAKLATAAWLSYSGGHSFNEAYSVFGFMTEGNFKPLSFNTLKTSSALSEIAIGQAYNEVIEASIALSG